MLTHDLCGRPEIEELMKMTDVRNHINRRNRRIRLAWIKNRIGVIFRFWSAVISFITSLMLFKVKKNERPIDMCRSTPEPYPPERDVPSIVVNENSFSDGTFLIASLTLTVSNIILI